MGNPLIIKNEGTHEQRFGAIINVLNAVTNQMYNGRVPQLEAETATWNALAAAYQEGVESIG